MATLLNYEIIFLRMLTRHVLKVRRHPESVYLDQRSGSLGGRNGFTVRADSILDSTPYLPGDIGQDSYSLNLSFLICKMEAVASTARGDGDRK